MRSGTLAEKSWKVLDHVVVALGTLSAVLIVLIMFLSSADVLSRNFVGVPIKGAYELNEIFFLCAALLGIAYAQKYKAHVNVELVVSHLSKRTALILETCMTVVALLTYALVVWMSSLEFLNSWSSDEFRWGLIAIPLWPARLMIPLGFTLLCLRFIGEIVININILRSEEEGV
jgi:TRAP-type mannitol/chloroaromatic compound transport system permease small subunit